MDRRRLVSGVSALGVWLPSYGAAKKNRKKPPPCRRGTKRCGKKCVDLDASKSNCGRCGNACPGELSCAEGTCVCKKNVCRVLARETDYLLGRIAAISSSEIAAFDIDDRIIVFDTSGRQRSIIGEFGDEPGEFDGPSGIASNLNGTLYVADSGNDRIQRRNSDGSFDVWPVSGWVRDVAVGSSDKPYALIDDQVCEFDGDGNIVGCWGPDGTDASSFEYPTALAADQSQHLCVLDSETLLLHKFTDNGQGSVTLDWSIGGSGVDPGEFRSPDGITIAGDSVLVADHGNERVQAFSLSDGAFQFQWQDEDSCCLWDPEGVAAVGGYIFVSSWDTILKFDTKTSDAPA